VLVLAGCGGSGGGGITVQPARQYSLDFTADTPQGSAPAQVDFRIVQPDGKPLTAYKRGSGPHTGVHVIYVRDDLSVLVHHHPAVGKDGRVHDTVQLPEPGRYRVVIDAYPANPSPQPNFQLFASLRKPGAAGEKPLPPPTSAETVDGYRITLRNASNLKAVTAGSVVVDVRGPDGKPASFAPWYGALAHAIFFRKGSLDYFHTHVCAPGAQGCTSSFGGVSVTGKSSKPGELDVGVLLPVPGTWRLFLQTRADGKVLTAPFTLHVS